MSARYQSLLSRIHAEWSEEDWNSFRASTRVPHLLTTMHEAAHWFQRQTLLERALHLVTVRALLEEGVSRTERDKEELRKVIACRRLLAPISEGLALYTQFDYFPANFYIGAGGRSSYDALVEFLVARRGFEQPKDAAFDLPSEAWDALVTARTSEAALQKKRHLLETPFLINDDHITGYLLVKASVAEARCSGYPFFVHDGLVIPLIMSLFYGCPRLIRLVLDPEVTADAFLREAPDILAERVRLLLDAETLAKLLFASRGKVPDAEHSVWFDPDRADYRDAQDAYSRAYNLLLKPIRSSVGEWIRPGQSIENYIDETYRGSEGDAPYPLDGFQLLASPHFGRLFTLDVTLVPTVDGVRLQAGPGNPTFDFPSTSRRAATYEWIRLPTRETVGRLTEAIVHLDGLDHDFFHASFISHSRGLLALTHNTRDYNVGHTDLGIYFQDAHRIDHWLDRIGRDVSAFEKEAFADADVVRTAKSRAYREGISSVVNAVLPEDGPVRKTGWTCGRDAFQSEEDFAAYIPFSLVVRIGDFSFEWKASLVGSLKRHLDRFSPGTVDVDRAKRFASSQSPLSRAPTSRGSIRWSSFSCLL